MGLNAELLEQSFKLVAPQGEKLVARFYERLFQTYPAVKPLFKKTSMKDQKKKLLASLVLVIRNLRHPEKLTKSLQALGARHVGYGAQPAHYDAVGENLLAVLGECAGPAWTPEVEQAWTEAYGAITTIMLEGARVAAPSPAHTQGGAVMAKGKTIKPGKKTADGNDLSAKVDAINKVQAVIEFDLDGNVLTANENFCKTLGYELVEIQGKHHRMFCDAAYTVSGEYAAFWQKLNRGEYEAGVYRRLGKGGKEIWIQASYNPILDANGKPYKVVKFATDVTAQKNQTAEFEGKIAAIGKAQAVIEFNLDGTVLTANENFCKTLGYELVEIQGKHHRMFCDAAYSSSSEYANFWAKLNRGEFDAGVYRRLGKGGKEIWIQASYNPILDANGKPYKVVKFATDVTEAKKKELVKSATDNSTSNILMCDRNLTITYINKAASDKLKALESEIRKVLPSFNADKIVGTCIDGFHKNPSQQRRILEDPKNLPHRAEIKLGPLTLSLTVSAIVSEKGEYLGNTLEWADITAQKQAQTEVQRLIGAAVEGRLAERAPAENFEGFYRSLAEGINQMLDALVERLTKVVGAVKMSTESVSTGSGEISQGTEDLSQRTSEQASALEETSSAMEEMTSTVKQNADNAKQANQLASAARDVAEQGGQVTTKAVAAMGEINKSSKKIADIITVIDEIAFQTNLLALNAAVEAARAGEHGRGFAVVAAEVRNLAQRSATAAKEIKSLINESIQRVTDGSDLVNQSGKTLEEIVNSVKRVADIVSEISAASQEQTTGIEQVNKAIMQMDETTQQNAALVEESASACQNLAGQAQRLGRLMESFKMKDGKVAEMTAIEEQTEEAPAAKAEVKTAKKPVPPVSGHRPPAAVRRAAKSEPALVGTAASKHEGNGHRVGANEFEEF